MKHSLFPALRGTPVLPHLWRLLCHFRFFIRFLFPLVDNAQDLSVHWWHSSVLPHLPRWRCDFAGAPAQSDYENLLVHWPIPIKNLFCFANGRLSVHWSVPFPFYFGYRKNDQFIGLYRYPFVRFLMLLVWQSKFAVREIYLFIGLYRLVVLPVRALPLTAGSSILILS